MAFLTPRTLLLVSILSLFAIEIAAELTADDKGQWIVRVSNLIHKSRHVAP
jgi:hypothetical protein